MICKAEEDRVMVPCEGMADKIGYDWKKIFEHRIWGTSQKFINGIHYIDDTTMLDFLKKTGHIDVAREFDERVRQPFYARIAARSIEQKLNYNVVYKNRKGEPHEENKITTESIGRVFGSSAQQINLLLSDAGLIYESEDKGGNIHWLPERELIDCVNAYPYDGTSPYVDYKVDYTHMYWTDRGAHWLYQNLVKKGWEPKRWT